MLSMQKIAVLAMACALGMVALPASAQDATSGSATGGRGGRGGGGGRGGAMFQAALDLTDLSAEQKDKITALKKESDDKMKEAREKMQSGGGQPSDEERTAMREKMMAAQKENKEKIEAILNADQKTKFEEALAKQPQGGGRWGGSRGTSGTAEAKSEPKADAAKPEAK